MKKCFLCKRKVMGKRYLGMCPRCFANLVDILVILFAVFVFPVVSNVLGFTFIIPAWGFLEGRSALIVSVFVIGVFAFASLICLVAIILLIIRLITRNKRL